MLDREEKPVTLFEQEIERSEEEIALVFFFFLWPRPCS
jgi:hypothetical protein